MSPKDRFYDVLWGEQGLDGGGAILRAPRSVGWVAAAVGGRTRVALFVESVEGGGGGEEGDGGEGGDGGDRRRDGGEGGRWVLGGGGVELTPMMLAV